MLLMILIYFLYIEVTLFVLEPRVKRTDLFLGLHCSGQIRIELHVGSSNRSHDFKKLEKFNNKIFIYENFSFLYTTPINSVGIKSIDRPCCCVYNDIK